MSWKADQANRVRIDTVGYKEIFPPNLRESDDEFNRLEIVAKAQST